MDKKVKDFTTALALGLVFTVLMSVANFTTTCDGIRNNVLRVHILANSDSTADQHLKLLVRDRVISVSEDMFAHCRTKEEAIACLRENLDTLSRAAAETVAENGYDYPVNLSIKKAEFETREYENFTLPAGEYDALCISIGEAKGQNWWCIMFPAFCVGAAEATLPEDQTRVIEGGGRYKVRFKAVEIFEEIRSILNF